MFRAILLNLKAYSINLTNLREIFVALSFTFAGIYFFIIGLTTGSLSPTEFYYINYCTLPYVNDFSVNPKDFLFLVIFIVSVCMMSNFNVWGIKQEAISILVLHLVYMILKGNYKMNSPKCYVTSESYENGYRLLFLLLNCVVFFWVYDDKNKIFRSVENLEPYQIKAWNLETYSKFIKFLKINNENELVDFIENVLIKTNDPFEVFENPKCIFFIIIESLIIY
jgi:hypothetical protein